MELHIEERRIAIATGAQRQLEGVNLFDPACPIDFIITVEALKEGWDCSFAYVFCTVQSVRSAKDMEQLLGRVLRLPYAQPRKSETLNRAYAHVCSTQTAAAANELTDRLVAMGFEEIEAAQFVQPTAGDMFGAGTHQLPSATRTTLALPTAVAQALVATAPDLVAMEPDAAGAQVTLTGVLPQAALDAAIAAVKARDRDALTQQLDRHQTRAQTAAAPAQRGVTFAAVPRLCVTVQGELALLDSDLLADLTAFSPTGLPTDLPDFAAEPDGRPYLIDVERGQLRIEQQEARYVLDLNLAHEGIRREDIIRDLDRRVHRDDVLQADMIAWLGKALDGVLARGIELTYVARHLNRMADAIARRLDALATNARRRAFQLALFGPSANGCLSDHFAFNFDPNNYPSRWFFNGRYQFRKHYYPRPGELQDDIEREETACAVELDNLDEVKVWVRNLERQQGSSFWLPTSTDRFYPDFVAELVDGRLFVVEYKGGDRYTNEDSKEKRDIGMVWAAASDGRCRFAMVTDTATAGRAVSAQLRAALA